MSEGYHGIPAAGGSRAGLLNGGAVAPTRPRKRIYDAEANPEEEVLPRRPGLYSGYHESIKGVAPYKKAERFARYNRRSESSSTPTSTAVQSSGPISSSTNSYEQSKSPMMQDDVNQGLADNFEDSLCGLGSDLASSTYNMSEAIQALPNVPVVKQEVVTSSPCMDHMNSSGGVGVGVVSSMMFLDEMSQSNSNSIDKLFKLLSSENTYEGGTAPNISQLLSQNVISTSAMCASTFSPSPSEDAVCPPSPPPPSSTTTSAGAHHHHHHHHHPLYNTTQLHLLHQHQGNGSSGSHHHHPQHQAKAGSPDQDEEGDRATKILGLSSSSSIVSDNGLEGGGSSDWGGEGAGGSGCGESDNMMGTRFTYEDQYDSDVFKSSHDDNRFQYILSVPTSTAVKKSEDTLSYLNQGQAYEIKIKKLGDITKCAGKKFTSLVRICFHERRFQYVEREQLSLWQQVRPNERIIEVDVPLSYGISDVQLSKNKLAVVQFDWDPNKDVAAYIKVNCISTEFTQRKHGGEKGVPFRIQIETYSKNSSTGVMERLYVCGCQIKVFKLKGADRKHKQDRDKISKLPASERDKYQESCECTILTTYTGDMIYKPDDRWSDATSTSYTPTDQKPLLLPNVCEVGGIVAGLPATSATTPTTTTSPTISASSTTHTSPVEQRKRSPLESLEKSGLTVTAASPDQDVPRSRLEGVESASQVQQWLHHHRFSSFASTLANFSAADLFRLSRGEMIEICGLADGIRMFNTLHAKQQVPRLTLFVRVEHEHAFNAVYLERLTAQDLVNKLCCFYAIRPAAVRTVYLTGPSGVHIIVSDEVVRYLHHDSFLIMKVRLSSPPTTPTLPSTSTTIAVQHTLILTILPRPFLAPAVTSSAPSASTMSESVVASVSTPPSRGSLSHAVYQSILGIGSHTFGSCTGSMALQQASPAMGSAGGGGGASTTSTSSLHFGPPRISSSHMNDMSGGFSDEEMAGINQTDVQVSSNSLGGGSNNSGSGSGSSNNSSGSNTGSRYVPTSQPVQRHHHHQQQQQQPSHHSQQHHQQQLQHGAYLTPPASSSSSSLRTSPVSSAGFTVHSSSSSSSQFQSLPANSGGPFGGGGSSGSAGSVQVSSGNIRYQST